MLRVVGTLVIVEDIAAAPEDLADDVGEPLLDPALPVPRWRISTSAGSAAVTSGVRKTIRYLRAEAGQFAMFRGFGYFLIYGFFEGLINGVLAACLRPFLSYAVNVVVPIFTPVLLWRFNNAWLHKVISKPSEKSWYTRVREQKGSWTVKIAIFLWAICRSVASFIPGISAYLLVLKTFEAVDGDIRFHGSMPKTIFESLGIFVLSLVSQLLLVLPATVIVVRLQASMLPANDEGILVLDKALYKSVALESPDGNTASQPTVAGYKLILLGVWRSFTWPACISLSKVYAKCYMIQIVLTAACTVAVTAVCLAFKSP